MFQMLYYIAFLIFCLYELSVSLNGVNNTMKFMKFGTNPSLYYYSTNTDWQQAVHTNKKTEWSYSSK